MTSLADLFDEALGSISQDLDRFHRDLIEDRGDAGPKEVAPVAPHAVDLLAAGLGVAPIEVERLLAIAGVERLAADRSLDTVLSPNGRLMSVIRHGQFGLGLLTGALIVRDRHPDGFGPEVSRDAGA